MSATPRQARRLLKAQPGLVLGSAMILVVVLFSVLYPLSGSYDAYGQNLGATFVKPFSDPGFLFGTDSLGRDVASRLALAGRVTLSLVLIVVLANAVIGLIIGTVSGYFGGWLDNVLMGMADVQLALPVTLVIIALSAVNGPSTMLMVTILALTFWVGYARVSRSVSLGISSRDFVLAPQLLGARNSWVIVKHIVPHVLTPVLILATADLGGVILLMSSFDFLGLGVQAPTPSWGIMINDGQRYLRQAPYLAILPGLAIFLFVAGTLLVSQQFTSESRGRRRRKPSTTAKEYSPSAGVTR